MRPKQIPLDKKIYLLIIEILSGSFRLHWDFDQTRESKYGMCEIQIVANCHYVFKASEEHSNYRMTGWINRRNKWISQLFPELYFYHNV